tara:strand:- start:108 stop:539 length:432 start_codon:yes stop_codon:yes gene_type:complete
MNEWELIKRYERNFRKTEDPTWLRKQFELIWNRIDFSNGYGQGSFIFDAYVIWKRICEFDESINGPLQENECHLYPIPETNEKINPVAKIDKFWYENLAMSNPARMRFNMDDIYRLRKEYNFDYFLRDDGKNYDGEVVTKGQI